MKKLLFISLSISCFLLQAQSDSLQRSTTSMAGSSTNTNYNGVKYVVHQSVGQSGPTGTTINNDLVVRQGFIQPFLLQQLLDGESGITLEIFPNPTVDVINVDLIGSYNDDMGLGVYDAAGRLVIKRSYSNDEMDLISLNIRHLRAGNYFIAVKIGEDQKVVQFNKQ
jgi:hypothetical protein